MVLSVLLLTDWAHNHPHNSTVCDATTPLRKELNRPCRRWYHWHGPTRIHCLLWVAGRLVLRTFLRQTRQSRYPTRTPHPLSPPLINPESHPPFRQNQTIMTLLSLFRSATRNYTVWSNSSQASRVTTCYKANRLGDSCDRTQFLSRNR